MSSGRGIGNSEDLAVRCALTAFSEAASAIDELIWDLDAMYGTALALHGAIHNVEGLVKKADSLLPTNVR
jgi:hypothetical protein